MTRLLSRFGLPLLAKELIEQAARKRTYVVRVLYAVLLFFAAYVFFYEILKVGAASPQAALGRGREMYLVLVNLQFAGVYVFMPAMTCGVLTQEKERASLQLLFLTRLGPWAILFEKLASRLVPMLCFLLLSLPLLAFAYSLGGISPELLVSGVWMLAISALQMGTVALACSAFFRTTAGAFIGSYLVSLIMFFGPGLCWYGLYLFTGNNFDRVLIREFQAVGLFPFFGIFALNGPVNGFPGIWPLAAHSVLVLLSSAGFLVLARVFVVRRAFLPPRNIVLNVFKRLDRTFHRLNENRVTQGIILTGRGSALPEEEPVAWRETMKRSLGKPQYLFRIFVAVEVPVAALCFVIAFAGDGAHGEPLSALLFLVWLVAVLLISAQASSLIAGERSHQTLDVLCTTPLTGKEIIRQKFRAVRRLIVVLLVPFLTIFFFVCAVKWRMPGPNRWYGHREFSLPLYLTCSLLSVAIYLPMLAWLSLFIGLNVRTQARAIIGSMGAIVAWCVLPIVFVTIPLEIVLGHSPRALIDGSALLSPATIIPYNEFDSLGDFGNPSWLAVILNFAAYATVLAVLRALCLANADRWLGRSDSHAEPRFSFITPKLEQEANQGSGQAERPSILQVRNDA